MNTVQRYNKVSIILHWLVGLALLCMFAVGFWMSDLPKDAPKAATLDLFNWGIYTLTFPEPLSPRAFYFNLHKSLGVTLLALILFRLFWRLTHPVPALPSTMKSWEKTLAEVVHKSMYVLMLVMPVSGLLMAVYSKYGVVWFGIPLISGLDIPVVRDAFKESHEMIGIVLLAVIVLHTLAAIKHKVVDKDDVMKRMSLR